MIPIKVHHDSHQRPYRHPFGAVECGQLVQLAFRLSPPEGMRPRIQAWLRLWLDNQREVLLPMSPLDRGEDDLWYAIDYQAPDQAGPVWYYFLIEVEGQAYYYCNNAGQLGGLGHLDTRPGYSYQLTVHEPGRVPAWYKEGLVYQIYVDRFHNGLPAGQIQNPKKGSLIHGRWSDSPFYIKDEKGHIDRWTFFGGNLQGVLAKLPYLASMGVTILYFNPIFEAASNHKYDTGDYHKIDPMYGDEALFESLIQEAGRWGMSVLLDGVFSHTGSDSLYFNRYGHYPGLGAYQSPESPYASWYRLGECGGSYQCWWGVEDLPNVVELDPGYMDFIFRKPDSVIAHWMSKGVKGWRLDVADELPDPFLEGLRQAVKALNPEGVLVGEVWEDASNKVSYDQLRSYFYGRSLDAVTHYPWRQILLDFLLEKEAAPKTMRRLMNLWENYPREQSYGAFNLIGSHDRMRILTILGEAPTQSQMSEKGMETYRLTPEKRTLAISRLKLMTLIQMTYPGVPCIYYGDEAGLEGYADPYNRGTYPWGAEDPEVLVWYQRMVKLRREYPTLLQGDLKLFFQGNHLLGYLREDDAAEIGLAVNPSQVQSVGLTQGPDPEKTWNLLEGRAWQRADETLPPLSMCLWYRSKAPTKAPLERSCGLLLPVASLPSPWPVGDFGPGALAFVQALAEGGHSLWQVLPLNPIGAGHSPYLSDSAFALNPLLVSPEGLVTSGWVTEKSLALWSKRFEKLALDTVDYQAARNMKEALLEEAYRGFATDPQNEAVLEEYRRDQEDWLEDYVLFKLMERLQKGRPWQLWPKAWRRREAQALALVKEKHPRELKALAFQQYVLEDQWQRLRRQASDLGVSIVGDLPIYVDGHSCDVWCHQWAFDLDELGDPRRQAGVPPDYFSEEGQLWGHPLYRWSAMSEEGYTWWKRRLKRALATYDWIRLDHFRGFEAYWSVPAQAKTAVEGAWMKGPGLAFFQAMEKEMGPLPILAEDLGYVTPEVANLKNILGYPGMKVQQFSPLAEAPEGSLDRTVYYSGTHDNQTLVGWLKMQKSRGPHKEARQILEQLYASQAPWVMIPVQDILGLGDQARMNTPGVPEGNWRWRLGGQAMNSSTRKELRRLAEAYGRVRPLER